MFKKTLLASAVIGAMLVSTASAETLRWTRSADGLTLDPHSQNEGPTHALNHQIFDALVYQDMDVEYQPGLATDWYVHEDDPHVWVFEIREGVTFHEGQALTADDVVFSLNRARHENADMRGLLTSIKEVRAADDHTVRANSPIRAHRIFPSSWGEALRESPVPGELDGGIPIGGNVVQYPSRIRVLRRMSKTAQ